MAGGLATAFVFSGRADPVWRIAEDLARELEAVWEELPVAAAPVPAEPGSQLGYRGCRVDFDDGGECFAYDGIVTRKIHGRTEQRSDPNRSFERAILHSAPAGAFPDANTLIDS